MLVASRGTGVCGSDLRILEGQAAAGDTGVGMVLGHEFCVEVLDYGPGTAATVPVGSLACRNPFVAGGSGFEIVGIHPNRPGAMAERLTLPADELLGVPPGVGALDAVLTEPLAVGIHAVASARARGATGPFLVVGCGPIGLAVVVALRHLGLGPIVASGRRASRRRMAAQLGADVVVDPADTSPFETWIEHGAAAAPVPPLAHRPSARPVVFDCVGSPGTLQAIIGGAVAGTHVVAVGALAQPDTIVPVLALVKSISIDFTFAYTPAEFALALERLASRTIDVSPMVTSVVGLDAIDGLVDRLGSDEEIKVVVTPS